MIFDVDILVNNAGAATAFGSWDHPNMLAEYDNVMKLNVRTVVEMTRLCKPFLEKSPFGANILNISSIASMKAVIVNNLEFIFVIY